MSATKGPVLDFPVKDKIVLITGGGSGIGLAFAQMCHEKGARVVIGDLRLTPEAQSFVSSVKSNTVASVTCDVTSQKSLHDLISASVSTFGDVPDIYAPVAGVLDPSWSNWWDDTEDDMDAYKTMQINLIHPLKLSRLAVRALAGANKQGVICLVSSSAGIRADYMLPLYVATKHGVVGFAKSMARADPDEGIRIVCVLPGTVRSNLWEGSHNEMVKEATKYSERVLMPPSTLADMMMRMVENKEYSGGTCVLKTAWEEKVVEEGWDKQTGKYDPSPRPDPDLSHIKGAVEKERGKKWV